MSDDKKSNNRNLVNVALLGAGAIAGALIAWFTKPDSSTPHHEHPPRHFQDAPPLYDSACAICLESHNVIMLPCEHSFDKVCIRNWFTETITRYKKMVCPTCRFAIPRNMENEYYERLDMDRNSVI